MTQGQRQSLWDAAGHPGIAPVGYGGESSGGGGGGGGGLNIPAFKFDYDQAEREAFAKLEPYYRQKLEEAQFDVDRAKRLIEEDYKRGKRYREEDLTTQLGADQLSREEEIRNTLTELNRRGVLFGEIEPGGQERGVSRAPYSDIAQRFTLSPLTERQGARKQAIERAISRQEEVAGVTRQRGIEEQDVAFPRYKRDLEEEKRKRALFEFVPLARERAQARYEESIGPSINQYLQR